MNRFIALTGLPCFLLIPIPGEAVTCSCAGVPLLSSMETATPDANSWFVGTSFQYRDLSEAVSGSDEVNDGIDRDRTTETLIAEVSYGFSDRWSASTLFSYVRHQREVGGGDEQEGKGIGDAIAMAKYAVLRQGIASRHGLTLGFGTRIPLGEEDEKGTLGIRLAQDMQPSTGAWGGIGWLNYNYSFNQAGTVQAYTTGSYTYNDENDRDYRFGHESTLELGGSYNSPGSWAALAGLRYRHTERDERNGVEIPNTGGEWLDFVPAVQYQFSDAFAAKLGATIPVWRDLNDALQFTTKYAAHLSLSYVF